MSIKENRTKLVAALRSGEFKQTTRTLRNGDAYCCLGVACELYRLATGKGHWYIAGMSGMSFYDEDGKDGTGVMSPAVTAFFGFNDQNPSPFVDEYKTLASINDDGATFEQIADIIEGME